MLSYNNTSKELKASGVDMAIIPVGSIEQHSSHLPIGTDMLLAEDFGRSVAEKLNALLLPALPFSTCYEHRGHSEVFACALLPFTQCFRTLFCALKTRE